HSAVAAGGGQQGAVGVDRQAVDPVAVALVAGLRDGLEGPRRLLLVLALVLVLVFALVLVLVLALVLLHCGRVAQGAEVEPLPAHPSRQDGGQQHDPPRPGAAGPRGTLHCHCTTPQRWSAEPGGIVAHPFRRSRGRGARKKRKKRKNRWPSPKGMVRFKLFIE